MVRWVRAKAEPLIDLSDDFIFATLVSRGITDDMTHVCDTTERQRDLVLADIYFSAATASVKTGTQGEADGGWTHYVAIKNATNRAGLLGMAKALYEKWNESYYDPTTKITLKPLY